MNTSEGENSKSKKTSTYKKYAATEGTNSRHRKFNIVFVKDDVSEDSSDDETMDEESDEDYSPSSYGSSEDEDSSVSSIDSDELSDYADDEEITAKIEEAIQEDKEIKRLTKEYTRNKSKRTNKAISACKDKIRTDILKEHAKNIKLENKYVRIFSDLVKKAKHGEPKEVRFFTNSCSMDEKYSIIKKFKETSALSTFHKPYRLQILESNIPTIFKSHALQKLQSVGEMDPSNGEYFKIKGWLDSFMKIPFGKYVSMPVNIDDGIDHCATYMEETKLTLDDAVYGLNDTKMQIMQLIGQLVSNPTATGCSIAIHGDKGIGKTSIVQDGISKILNRPFAFIPLGGATDSSYLEGHAYTYEGSTCGKIVQILMDCKVMNPVIYFDELDKISDTPKGAEITNILLHLTDTTQNGEFHDKYFSDLHFDVSKCIFIFSYNDETRINPVLKDRMYTIHAKGYNKMEKIAIARKYLIKKISVQVNFTVNDVYFSDDVLGHIIEKYCNGETGVRNLKRCIETIYTKLNLCRIMNPGTNVFGLQTVELVLPCRLTSTIVDVLLKTMAPCVNTLAQMMYI
jgi:ATP-dependent Lon protease